MWSLGQRGRERWFEKNKCVRGEFREHVKTACEREKWVKEKGGDCVFRNIREEETFKEVVSKCEWRLEVFIGK